MTNGFSCMRELAHSSKTLALAAAMAALSTTSARQSSAQTVRVGFDTTKASADVRAVVRVYREYMDTRRGLYFESADRQTSLWVEPERRMWPMYDLASLYLHDLAVPTVEKVEAVGSGNAPEYRITTNFVYNDPTASSPTWWSNMTTTVYAVRNSGAWQLANALPRNTASFKRDTVRSFEYVYAPSYPFNRARAESAAAFADSLADVFNVPRIGALTYYLSNTVDEMYALMGLTSAEKVGATGGVAQPVNRMLFSGIPAIGENYRHELAHMVFRPLMTPSTSLFVSEGVPTWYGGTGGKSYKDAVAGLAVWLRAHPQVTLDSLMRPGYSNTETYTAAAVVVDIVSDQVGRHGIRLLFDAGASASELREGLQRITKFGWARLSQEWHDRVMDQAPPG
jgi:hypothetical protein